MTITRQRLTLIALVLPFATGPTGLPAQTNTNATVTAAVEPLPVATRMDVRAGLRMELVADGSLVDSPTAMAFDERGRLFVAEQPGRSAQTPWGRIRLLEDSDGDGDFDTSVVVDDGLDRPGAVACFRGGVFVAGPSQLMFLQDRNGDDIADLRRTLLTFSGGTSSEGPTSLSPAMTWGPDGRVYVALPFANAQVMNPNNLDQSPLDLSGGGFSFDPLTLSLRAESGGLVTSQAFDEAGRRLFCSPSATLAVSLLNSSEANRNPFAPAMPTSARLVPGSRTGGPLDCLIYEGHAYSTKFQQQVLFADPRSGEVYGVALQDGEIHPTAVADEGSTLVTLVKGKVPAFRPTQLATGPDDLLYIADLDRNNDPESRSTTAADSDDGSTSSGAIWRLVPTSRSVKDKAQHDFSNTDSLTDALGHSNTWIRSTAARLLLEGRGTDEASDLRKVLAYAKQPAARLDALRSLDSTEALTARDLIQAMGDKDASIRATAVGLAADQVSHGRIADSLWAALRSRSADQSPEIRLRVALTLGSVQTPPSSGLLANLYMRDSANVWMHRAMLTAHPVVLGRVFIQLLREPGVSRSPEGRALLQNMAASVGLGGRLNDVSDCLWTLRDLDAPTDLAFPIIIALAEGLEGRGLRLSEADGAGHWLPIANTAQTIAVGGQDALLRSQAVRVMGACVGPDFVADEYLLLMFAPGLAVPMQIPVIQALAQQGLQRDFHALTQRWHFWDSPEQLATIDALIQSGQGANALLTAIADGTIPIEALTSVHINLLRDYRVDDVGARANRMFGSAQPDRSELVNGFVGAVDLDASVATGRQLFDTRCSYCHRSRNPSFGPSLASMRTRSGLQLVAGITDPSRELASDHLTTVIRFSNGRMTWGAASDVNQAVFQLSTPHGIRRYVRGAVESVNPAGWSLMPDNAAAGLTLQDVADLVDFIQNGPVIR